MTLPIQDMQGLLITANVGVAGGSAGAWPIFLGSEPDDPNDVITLYDIPGEAPNPKWSLDYPRFMVRVRSVSYLQAYTKAEEIKATLLGLPSQDIGAIRYVGIWVVTETHFLKADDEGRSIFVSTWRIIREPPAVGNRQPL